MCKCRRVQWGFSARGSQRKGTPEANPVQESGPPLAPPNALGDAAQQFIRDGVGGRGKLLKGGVVSENLDPRAALN